jgi:hypothetical protein
MVSKSALRAAGKRAENLPLFQKGVKRDFRKIGKYSAGSAFSMPA